MPRGVFSRGGLAGFRRDNSCYIDIISAGKWKARHLRCFLPSLKWTLSRLVWVWAIGYSPAASLPNQLSGPGAIRGLFYVRARSCCRALCSVHVFAHMGGMLIQDETPANRPPRVPFYRAYPPVLLALAGVIIAVSVVQFLVPPEIENEMFLVGAVISGSEFADIKQPFGAFAPLVLHTFLHGGVLHLGMNMWAMMSIGAGPALVMGKSVRGMTAFLAFFFLCAIGGGLAQIAVFQLQGDGGVAVGASSAISGLLPALGWLQGRWKRALQISVPWLLINLGLAVFGGLSPIPIAWAAHLGGLAAGFSFPFFLAWARR